MHMIIESIIIDNLNYEAPVTITAVTDINANTNTNSWNRIMMFFKNVDISTDAGFLFSEYGTRSYNSIDSVTMENIYTLGTSTIFSHIIANSKFKEVYKRKYIKVQDVFALMGGFINGVLLFMKILVRYLTYPRLLDIFNSLYMFVPIIDLENYNLERKVKILIF